MIDPATRWFEIVLIPNKRADEIANLLEQTWLARYPWPQHVICDRGREFMAEVQDLLTTYYGLWHSSKSNYNSKPSGQFYCRKGTPDDREYDKDLVGRRTGIGRSQSLCWTAISSSVCDKSYLSHNIGCNT